MILSICITVASKENKRRENTNCVCIKSSLICMTYLFPSFHHLFELFLLHLSFWSDQRDDIRLNHRKRCLYHFNLCLSFNSSGIRNPENFRYHKYKLCCSSCGWSCFQLFECVVHWNAASLVWVWQATHSHMTIGNLLYRLEI